MRFAFLMQMQTFLYRFFWRRSLAPLTGLAEKRGREHRERMVKKAGAPEKLQS